MTANEDIRPTRDLDPYDDEPEEDFEDEEPRRRSGRALPIAVATLAIVGFTVIVYYAYQQGIRAGSEQNPPLIKAEEGPSKVRPAAPGGMEVPNQNMKVYELGRPQGQQQAAGAERILPKPEEPLQRPAAPVASAPVPVPGGSQDSQPAQPAQSADPPVAAIVPQVPGAPASGGQNAQVGVNAPPPPPLPGQGQASATPAPAPAASQPAQPRAGGPAVSTPPPPPAPSRDTALAAPRGNLTLGGVGQRNAGAPQQQAAAQPPAQASSQSTPQPAAQRQAAATGGAAGGAARVQLSAADSNDGASKAAKGYTAKFGDLLGGLGNEIEKFDNPKDGKTYYRVLFGPLGSKADAAKLCEGLKARGQGCIVR